MPKSLIPTVLTLLTLLAFGTGPAFAASDCATQATEKKLAGAAKTSFLKKCERDAGSAAAASAPNPVAAACAKSAADKKLAGAAKASHIKKCTAEGGPKG
jgi:hypothetical protein